MPTITNDILKDEYDMSEDIGITSKKYQKFIHMKWYSEGEVRNIIEKMIKIAHDLDGSLLECPVCGVNMNKINEYTYEPDCGCFKGKIRIGRG